MEGAHNNHVPNQDASTVPRSVPDLAIQKESAKHNGVLAYTLCYHALVQPQSDGDKAVRQTRNMRQEFLNFPPLISSVWLIEKPDFNPILDEKLLYWVPMDLVCESGVRKQINYPFPGITILKLELVRDTLEFSFDLSCLELYVI
jgi:hypothetical protein